MLCEIIKILKYLETLKNYFLKSVKNKHGIRELKTCAWQHGMYKGHP